MAAESNRQAMLALAAELDRAEPLHADRDAPADERRVLVRAVVAREASIALAFAAGIADAGARMAGHRATCASLDITGVRRACDCGAEA